MTRVVFDPNVRIKNNMTYAAMTDADGPVAQGDRVLLVEPEGGIEVSADAVHLSVKSGLIYFAVDWDTLRRS